MNWHNLGIINSRSRTSRSCYISQKNSQLSRQHRRQQLAIFLALIVVANVNYLSKIVRVSGPALTDFVSYDLVKYSITLFKNILDIYIFMAFHYYDVILGWLGWFQKVLYEPKMFS